MDRRRFLQNLAATAAAANTLAPAVADAQRGGGGRGGGETQPDAPAGRRRGAHAFEVIGHLA